MIIFSSMVILPCVVIEVKGDFMKLKISISKEKASEIQKKLDIPQNTMYRWLRLEKIEQFVKFNDMLKIIGITYEEVKEMYEKNKKEDI